MNYNFVLLFFFFTSTFCYSQGKEYNTAIVRINQYTEGTLVTPYSENDSPLVIFVMDAGEINRDGNDRMSRNDAFQKLAVALAKRGISTFRYDKRLLKIDALDIQPYEVVLDDFVDDANFVATYFKRNGNSKKIVILGHGQGSLVGMLAVDENVDSFISIAGNAKSVDKIVVEQLAIQTPGLDKSAARAFAELKIKGSTTNYDPALESIFGHNVRGFMKSWMKYTPKEEIKNLNIPILILQGDKDLQVEKIEAKQLKENAPNAELIIIKDMNHILREIKGGRLENHKSYNEYWLEIMPEVIDVIANFVNQ